MIDAFRNAREAIQAVAAEWVLRLDEEPLTPSARAELLKWLKASPQHVEEFLLATAAWRDLDGIDAQKRLDVDALLAEAESNVVTLSEAMPGVGGTDTPARQRIRWLGGLAATVLVVVGAALTWPPAIQVQHYETGLGQQTLFTLDDGSIVHLNTQSELTVRLGDDSRELNLRRGEALFHVARDPERPFRVRSGDVTVEAIGTQFNVYRRHDGVQVTVVEGTVKVEPLAPAANSEPGSPAVTLEAGEEARSRRSGEVARVDAPDIEKRTAWREQRLVFRDDPLLAVATEFNRYNQLQIDVNLPDTIPLSITATFDAHDPQSFIAFLERDPALRVTRINDRIVVRSAD